ncbi:hypothetical protein [Janthinobacterium sp. AD80]|uniref:hypothetical protein n=1 Tax=Janthinobacterium sp. AD80 TaxID=1528773 RepID=UPI000C844E2F|nr:hypothetical protein [Janthinobacterium sp. AD80]PMQ07952.1 hypothetical protein JaAD80_27605 [Janthinobacterium sp. AD80]
MLHVPDGYTAARDALLTLPTGQQLLHSVRMANARAIISHDLNGAYGRTVDALTIHLTPQFDQLSLPQKACIIAHELTHAHDLSFANLNAEDYRDSRGLGDTEINAHFNQGQVLREFRSARARFAGPDALAIDAACAGVTVFGRSVGWITRADVVSHLANGMYAGHVVGWRLGAGIYSDDMYTSAARPFHCDENWHTFRRVLPVEEEGEVEEIHV